MVRYCVFCEVGIQMLCKG